jgi:hypothetical protein
MSGGEFTNSETPVFFQRAATAEMTSGFLFVFLGFEL